ncbi:hypothetical protein F4801DRAFT_533349 [Xylaria longipes]|nr:hypothetical protein F4801DRAFT_533349 [Xylaria longipes]
MKLRTESYSPFIGLMILSSLPYVISVPKSYNPYSLSARCPLPCNSTSDRTGWAHYQDVNQLSSCNQTMLLDMNLYNQINITTPQFSIRACLMQESTSLTPRQSFSYDPQTNSTRTTFDAQVQTLDIQILQWLSQGSDQSVVVTAAGQALTDAVIMQKDGSPNILFAQVGQVIMGVYAGSQIKNKGVGDIIGQFTKRISGQKFSKAAAQLCSSNSLGSEILGIFVDISGNLVSVQSALRDWNDAKCAESEDKADTWKAVSIPMVPGTEIAVGPNSGTVDNPSKRSTCPYTQAVSGDGCYSLAERCKITQDQLVSYNNDPNLCSDLQIGQYVCCAAGTLPDFTPQPNPDGTCKTYTIQANDLCSTIAKSNMMTVNDINARNKDTWGWTGCNYLIVGSVICLSTGSPPLPGPVANAVCGPTVPGTKRPADISTLADLNPCPLKACCNVWGQCGITKDFCIPSPADTGAPGTATPGSNGCVSSCGLNITNNAAPPSTFKRVGYFEAWNEDRPCLHMKPSQIDTTYYTHVHFAFANITESFQVDIGGLQTAYDGFKALRGVKRILSFGGWSFSTDYDTFPIFRQGVTPEQRQTFANNVASYIVDQGLDGVDFDWEYPGAPDIPGIPAGSPEDGPNYLAFLKLVRAALPTDKSIGIAAPASYWYLKGFPINDIGAIVDYIVYETYDLHGQWDYGNTFSVDGCPAGNCLRSHVNKTETENALAMITKAGVPASKVLVGMALYGRSFRMTSAGCYDVDCTFTGPGSGATPGRCTETAGYVSNFEIRDMLASDSGAMQYSSDDGDILVYNDVQWVSWMTKELYDDRVSWVKGLNFGGLSDWAIDLDADYGADDGAGDGDNGSGPVYISPDIYTEPDPIIQCYPPCTLIFPPWVLPSPTTISIDPVTVTYRDTWETTVTISGGIITTSAGETTSTVITLPPITTQTIQVSNVVWGSTLNSGSTTSAPSTTSSTLAGGIIWLTSSIIPPPVTITQTQTRGVSTGTPIVWTYSPGPVPTSATTSPGPPGPPPPPPPGFPSTVKVSPGPPKPTCRPGQICGSPCLINCGGGPGCIICGCIGPFCPPGGNCIGPGCSDSGGTDGNGNPDDSSSCRKRTTASYCDVECSVLEYPASTTTTCKDPDCTRTITACTATDSTSTTTTTLTCPTFGSYNDGDPNDQVPLIGDGGDGGFIIDPGDFDTMTNPPTTTPTLTPTSTTSTFEIAIYASSDCAAKGGDYYVIEGPALPELSPDLACLTLPNDLPQNILDDSSNNCRYFMDGGSSYGSCSGGKFDDPKSWSISSGRCQVFDGEGCDHLDLFDYYFVEGCHNYGAYDYEDIKTWRSLWCFSTGPVEEAFKKAGVNDELTLDYPSTSALDVGGALCWANYQNATSKSVQTLPDKRYQSITQDAAQQVVASWCAASYTLKAESTSGFAQAYYSSKDDRHALIAEMKWADDQTGCGTKQDIELFRDGCLHAFDLAYFGCKCYQFQ